MEPKGLQGEVNPGFVSDSGSPNKGVDYSVFTRPTLKDDAIPQVEEGSAKDAATPERQTWGSGAEFLMSCIAMSVGLGNIWRFPFTAYDNGGGAFLIPYIIVLLLVGKPLYFLEMVLGQFSSKGSVKVYDFAPIMRGIGAGQTVAVICVMTYYSSLMSLILYYLLASFSSVLPWTICDSSWGDICYPSGEAGNGGDFTNKTSSSELYFTKTVLRELDNIDDGIGVPGWKLTLCLLFAWITVFLVLLKGVKSSGKAAYFLALFPYLVMFILLIRAVTLPGAADGILFFIYPDFKKILNPQVWYAAVTQCFFSLNVCFGNVIMYSSYNNFRHNIYRDSIVVTSMDTLTSLIAGFTIFGVLGNLAHESGKDVASVVKGGTGLAFISYPEAISKFNTVPQLFSVLFFLMLYVLGVGSNVAMVSSIITVIRDKFPKLPHWVAISGVSIFGFGVALIYVTPGGQYMLTLVDHHGASFIVYILGIGQLIAIAWIYKTRNFSDDIEFMLNRKIGIYWRLCWPIVTPLILIVILLYSLVTMEKLDYNGVVFPVSAIVCGWLLSSFGIMQLPIFGFLAVFKRRDLGMPKMITTAFKPRDTWGPVDPSTKTDWITFKEKKKMEREERSRPKWRQFFDYILGY